MAGCIQNLLAQSSRNFYRFKELDRAPLKDRIQDLVHGLATSMLSLQHTYVAIATWSPPGKFTISLPSELKKTVSDALQDQDPDSVSP